MALDPVTLKLVGKVAVSSLSDEENRKKLLIIILTPIISILLLIAFIVHILTSPLGWFAEFLLPDDLKAIEEFQIDYGYNQTMGVYENDYINGIDMSYEGVTFSDGLTEVMYYSQLDSRWANLNYGVDKIGTHGCGPTSMSIVVSSLTDRVIDPVEMSNWAVANGGYCEGSGSYHSFIPNSAQAFGLNVEGNLSAQGLVDALAEGKLVVAIMSKGHFTSSGHFIVLRGVTADGKILVADPASTTRSEQEWDLEIFINEAHKSSGSGGPFWAIGN